MVNAKKTTFAATKVVGNGLAIGAAFMRILELDKGVLRLWHYVLVLLKWLNRKEEKGKGKEKEEVAVRGEVEAEVVAVGASLIASGAYKAVAEKNDVAVEVRAEEIVAGIEVMSVGSEDDEDKVVDSKIVVRLSGDRKRRIVEEEEGRRVEGAGEKGLVRAILVGPRLGVYGSSVGVRVPRRPSVYFSRGRGGMGSLVLT